MKRRTDRRTVLKYTLGTVAAMAAPGFPGVIRAQDPAGVTRLADNLAVIDAGGSNVLALTGGDGMTLVDSGMPGRAGALMETLEGLSGAGVRTLFNTHWHREQCGANVELGRAGATIIAHQKTRLRLSTEYYLPPEERYVPALPEAGRPTQAFHEKGSLDAGGERIDYGYLVQAHTDGDIYVHFRDANVLAAGDVVSPVRDPELDWYGGGWLGGRVDALDRLLELSDADTRIVPAYGPVIGRAELQAERDLMAEVFQRLVDLAREGCGAECMLDEGALEGLDRTWADPYRFLYAAYKGLWAHRNNLAPNII